jgi:hypothetical protein
VRPRLKSDEHEDAIGDAFHIRPSPASAPGLGLNPPTSAPGLGLTPPTSAPGLGLTPPTSAPGLGLTPLTSAPGLDSGTGPTARAVRAPRRRQSAGMRGARRRGAQARSLPQDHERRAPGFGGWRQIVPCVAALAPLLHRGVICCRRATSAAVVGDGQRASESIPSPSSLRKRRAAHRPPAALAAVNGWGGGAERTVPMPWQRCAKVHTFAMHSFAMRTPITVRAVLTSVRRIARRVRIGRSAKCFALCRRTSAAAAKLASSDSRASSDTSGGRSAARLGQPTALTRL